MNVLFLTPLPGTRLWKQMAAEGRIAVDDFPDDWKYFTLNYPVAHYKHLSQDQVIREMNECNGTFYSTANILSRLSLNLLAGRNPLLSLVSNLSFAQELESVRPGLRGPVADEVRWRQGLSCCRCLVPSSDRHVGDRDRAGPPAGGGPQAPAGLALPSVLDLGRRGSLLATLVEVAVGPLRLPLAAPSIRPVTVVGPSFGVDAGAGAQTVGVLLGEVQVGVPPDRLPGAFDVVWVLETRDDVAHLFVAAHWRPPAL